MGNVRLDYLTINLTINEETGFPNLISKHRGSSIGHRPGFAPVIPNPYALAATTRIFWSNNVYHVIANYSAHTSSYKSTDKTNDPHHHRGISSLSKTNTTKTTLNTTKAYVYYIHSQNGQCRYFGRRLQVEY